MRRDQIVLTGVGTSMVVAGTALGVVAYFLLKRKLEKEFEAQLRTEIEETKAFYSKMNKREGFSDPTELAKVYEEKLETEHYIPDTHQEVIAQEEADRNEEEPYVISWEEFAEGLKEYEQDNLTYFENDDVVVDGRNDQVDFVEVLGLENLSKFGHRSRDNNIVYIRNDKLGLDFEVVRNKGSYAKEVLGFIEHSEPRGRPRKFRRDYA